jgi:hypothetical protein
MSIGPDWSYYYDPRDDFEPEEDPRERVSFDLMCWLGSDKARLAKLLDYVTDQLDVTDADDFLKSITGKRHVTLMVQE